MGQVSQNVSASIQQALSSVEPKNSPWGSPIIDPQTDGMYTNITKTSDETVGYSGETMPEITREEISAKIEAAEARTDTKIARLEGKIDLVISKLDDVRSGQRATVANIWVVGLGIMVLIVGVAALFPAFFNMGESVKDMVDQAVQKSMSNFPRK
jgi:hypothetical protein